MYEEMYEQTYQQMKENFYQTAFSEGFTEGFAEGFSEGKAEGLTIGKLSILLKWYKKLIRNNVEPSDAFSEVTEDESAEIRDALYEKIQHEQLI